jgi:ribosomal protein S6
MADAVVAEMNETGEDTGISRVYEIGYHIAPSVKEEDVEKIVGAIRSEIEKSGGSFIAEGAPAMTKLSYSMQGLEAGKRTEFDRSYFGWIKFEAPILAATSVDESLKTDKNIIRHILFQTVREDTRAKVKMATLREVRRTDTIKTTAKRPEETSAPLSEADLDKAIEVITAE